ncbi:MAG TPA: hypothetical protein VFD30_22055 [Terriglobia bacterium]|nr:hypothetical protein [Terriglobia bacterium]
MKQKWRVLRLRAAGTMLGVFLVMVGSPAARAWSWYSGTSVDSTGKVWGWAVTDGTDVMGFMYHVAYVYTTLTSPKGRVSSTAPYWYQAMQSVRADVSLPYDPTDLGVYHLASQHRANCSFMGDFIPPGTNTHDDNTVPYVVLSLRTSGTVSTDNSARSEYNRRLGSYALGPFFSTGAEDHLWQIGVEIKGAVSPNTYTGSILFKREIVAERIYDNSLLYSSKDNVMDGYDRDLQDQNPQSGPAGIVYDLDAPGVGNAPADPIGNISRQRINFREWAELPSGEKVSKYDLNWFSRLSVRKRSTDEVLDTGISGDNSAGTPSTKLTWNLQ